MKETDRSVGTRHEESQYDDIIHLPHHVSQIHAQMSRHDRAAQFSPFSALSGHDAAIKETARLTAGRIELDESSKEYLDEKIRLIQKRSDMHPEITVTYFQPDSKKEGGAYVEVVGLLKKIDTYKRELVLQTGVIIPIDEVIGIEGGLS